MLKNTTLSITLVIIFTFLLAICSSAQSLSNQQSSQGSSNEKTTQPCKQKCQNTVKDLDGLSSLVSEAIKSNNPENMKTTLEQTETTLIAIKTRMSMCTNMMDNKEIERMSGMMNCCKMMENHSNTRSKAKQHSRK